MFGNAGAVVLDTEIDRLRHECQTHGDVTARLRIADGVVDQIAEHFTQQKIVAVDVDRHCGLRRAFKAKINAAQQGARHPLGGGGAREIGDVQSFHCLRVCG